MGKGWGQHKREKSVSSKLVPWILGQKVRKLHSRILANLELGMRLGAFDLEEEKKKKYSVQRVRHISCAQSKGFTLFPSSWIP